MEIVDRWDVKCGCGKNLSLSLTNGLDKCVYCYCCILLGKAIVEDEVISLEYSDPIDIRESYSPRFSLCERRYADDGDGYVDEWMTEVEDIQFCPFCGKELKHFFDGFKNI